MVAKTHTLKPMGSSPKREPCRRVNTLIMKLMEIIIALIFLAWLTLWILYPTPFYKEKWQPVLRSKTNSIAFGRQGTNMLLFASPILLLSILGSVYLHLVKKKGVTRWLKCEIKEFRRPFLVKGPLGIVTVTEFTFCVMFLLLLIWYFCMYLTADFVKSKGRMLHNLESVALRCGLIGNLCLAFLFFPVARGSSILPLFGLTSESSIKYHIWLGHIAMALFTAHGFLYIVFWAVIGELQEVLQWQKVGVANIPGELALLSGLCLWITTLPRIRRKIFELFFYTHQLYVLFLVFFLLHVGPGFICLILPGIYLFMVDRFLRFLQSRNKVRLVGARLLPSETVELNFSKSTDLFYSPMSTVFVNVPNISRLQWHPFTVSSSSRLEPGMLSVVIKREGSWTQKLYDKLSSPSCDHLDVSVEGPYGPVSTDFLRYDSLVMVSGGSGITPFFSVIRELIYHNVARNQKTPSITLICSFKTSSDLTMLDLLLPISSSDFDISQLQLRVEAFVTREEYLQNHSTKLIRTAWFKQNLLDLPISPVLGPNSWLWLGAILFSAFVAFLVLVGLLTRYYIYPKEERGGMVHSVTKSLWNLLILCCCVAAASGLSFLWNKKRASMEFTKVQDMEMTMVGTPYTSPSFLVSNDVEVEIDIKDTIRGFTTVHFGRRPDLKGLLRECEGSRIGVFASGPRALRQEVARICSLSGVRSDAHFESISFSW